MAAEGSRKLGPIEKLKLRLFGPPTQASLFHYVKEEPEPSVWSEYDWDVVKHPIRTLKEEWKGPRERASLFGYLEERKPREPIDWKEFFKDLLSFKTPLFISSLFAQPEELAIDRAQLRTRRVEAGAISMLLHGALIGLAVFLVMRGGDSAAQKDVVVFVSQPMDFPFQGDGRDGGGGGGGGKNEPTPPSFGAIPETTRVQMVAPDPEDPRPLVPVEDLMAQNPSIQMPIDLPQDLSMAIGDITAPPSQTGRSSGSGSGGGIGTGTGTGVGSGRGPGLGPGEGGGMGGGRGGGIGSGVGPYVAGIGGVRPPVVVFQPLPAYTEEARKARTEGVVLIQAVIRRDGTVDSFRVIRGLGFGLDESAINTIATKWRFKPGTLDGRPVDVQANIEVTFRLY